MLRSFTILASAIYLTVVAAVCAYAAPRVGGVTACAGTVGAIVALAVVIFVVSITRERTRNDKAA